MPLSLWHMAKRWMAGAVVLATSVCYIEAQSGVGAWNDHLNYAVSSDVALSPGMVFSSNGLSLLSFDKEYGELRSLSTVNMLSEVGIASIEWSDEYETLVIAYSSTNIDLLKGNNIVNIPDIYRKHLSEGNVINKVRCYGRYAYVACGFGIVVVDMEKKEVHDTWRPSFDSRINGVNDIAFGAGKIYAATDNGLFMADIGDEGLAYFGNWRRIESLPDAGGKYNAAIWMSGILYVNNATGNASGDIVYSVGDNCSTFLNEQGVFFNSFDLYDGGFVFSSRQKVFLFHANGVSRKTISQFPYGVSDIRRTVVDGDDIWLADANNGLVKENASHFDVYVLDGPSFTDGFKVVSSNGLTTVAGGGVSESWNNMAKQAMVSVYADGRWTSAISDDGFDAMTAVVDPTDRSRIIVSTYGNGLLEYRLRDGDLSFVRSYQRDNSPIEAIAGDNTERISGISFDADGNLWVVQPQVSHNIKMLKHDGTWVEYPNNISVNRTGDMFISSKGIKWIIIPGGGLYLFDDNGTPEMFSDDKSCFVVITDVDGATYGNIYCVAEDLDGYIWLGTDKGPLVYTNQSKCFDADFRASHIKISRDDGSGLADYLLGTETITSIAFDGGNRRWFGTKNSGAYLISSSGNEVIDHFTSANSPLFSNTVVSLSVDGKDGYVWMQTPVGLLSYRGYATDGKDDFKNVYAFPNPVRETYDGDLTITGLERDTQVRITDISGNLVYKTVSEGGQAIWNLKTYNGKRVATGVYLAFCSNADGSDATVIKVLVIR